MAARYPEGAAARANVMPLTSLGPSPDFCETAAASRAFTARVEQPEQLRPALDAAIRAARTEGRAALRNVLIAP
uniref:hypothetical protein n=1 Tax=uncultured Paracoccus sp. TaxID=189685 RepID=UPI00351A7D38